MYGVRLTWQDLPGHVCDWVGQVLGGTVVTAVSQPGGFSPGSADRVVTASGRRAFVKAASPEQNPDTPGLHRREAEVLRTLTGVPEVPQLIDNYDDGDWVVLVVEDVEGRHPHLPWTHDEVERTLGALTGLSTVAAPAAWPALEGELVGEFGGWRRVMDDPVPQTAAVAEARLSRTTEKGVGLDAWLHRVAPGLHALAQATVPRLAGCAVSHTDLRADNLLVEPDGTVRIVDWPWAARGAAWFDAVGLLVNVRWSGDLDVRPHLSAIHALGAGEQDVLGALAGLGGFLVDASRQPPPPGLPTLRDFQAAQGRACLTLLRELGVV